MDSHDDLEDLEHSLINGLIGRSAFITRALGTGLVSAAAANSLADELDAMRSAQVRQASMAESSFDYVVVGAGAAGCALVGTLAKKHPSAQILLIEAGDWDMDPAVKDPRLWFTNLGTERDWNDAALPSTGVNNRTVPESTGQVVGGGSSINATIWTRPFKADLDHWAEQTSDPLWGYEHGRDLLAGVENWNGTAGPYRGTGGPVWVQPPADPSPLATAALDGLREIDLPVVDDLNCISRELTGNGFGYMNQTIKDGRRHSMARAFLYPVLTQDNVTVMVGTHVNRVQFRGGRAVGVECARSGVTFSFEARREIVLSAGAFNTPKILLLSGIGDQTDLRALGLPVQVHSPEVGKNVQDHILHGGCLYEAPEPFDYRNNAANMSGYYKSDPGLERPDISLVQIELPYASESITAQYNPPPTTWALCAGLVAPESRGTVRLRSADPTDRPIVDMRFLSHPADLTALERSISIARKVAASAAVRPFVVREIAPGKDLTGEELTDFVRNGATTYFHASGACRMGDDDGAVVDPALRVNGVQGLRIADSTIMPRIVSVPTMPACVLIGLRLAEMLVAAAEVGEGHRQSPVNRL